ncbi:MAG: purine-binding chemotaxis protein CheW [Marinilabiliaceae bacterium]|nr:purine-binding chemotaxis protein CheW [Marinilabiliaceae bacterium]
MEDNLVNTTYLSFTIGSEEFAVNVGKVLEVLQKQSVSPVPNTPDYFSGVINFRGEIIPVIDTRTKLGLPGIILDENFVIIVIEIKVEHDDIVVGAIVDKVKDVISIQNHQIMPVPKMNKEVKTDFFTGIVRSEDGFIIIINFDKIIVSDEAVMLTEFTQASENMLNEITKEELEHVDES